MLNSNNMRERREESERLRGRRTAVRCDVRTLEAAGPAVVGSAARIWMFLKRRDADVNSRLGDARLRVRVFVVFCDGTRSRRTSSLFTHFLRSAHLQSFLRLTRHLSLFLFCCSLSSLIRLFFPSGPVFLFFISSSRSCACKILGSRFYLK